MLTNNENLDNACKIADDINLTDEQKANKILLTLGLKPKFTSIDEFNSFFDDPNAVLKL